MKSIILGLLAMCSTPAFANCELKIQSSDQIIWSDSEILNILGEKNYIITVVEEGPNFFVHKKQKYPIYWNHPIAEKLAIYADQFFTRSVVRYSAKIDNQTVASVSLGNVSFPEDSREEKDRLELRALRKLMKILPTCP